MDYVKRVRAARGSLNLSLDDFAALIGVGRSTLIRIENGTREPKDHEYEKMADKTGLPLAFFLVPNLEEAMAGPAPSESELDELRTDVKELRAAVTALSADSVRHSRELQELRRKDRRGGLGGGGR